LKVCVTCLLTTGIEVAELVLLKGDTLIVGAEELVVVEVDEDAERPVAVATETGELEPDVKSVSGVAVPFRA